VFDELMSAATAFHVDAILDAWDFGGSHRVVDVGAQRGVLLGAVLARYPSVRGVWFDRAEELPAGREGLEGRGLSRRCEFVVGSFFDEVPSGGDLYVLKHVLHDWPDPSVATILANVARAMPREASLLIIEGVLDAADPSDGPCLLRDLEQMAWTGGRLRTRKELEALLETAGLRGLQLRRTPIPDLRLLHARRTVDRP
jgi:hypothetical protein